MQIVKPIQARRKIFRPILTGKTQILRRNIILSFSISITFRNKYVLPFYVMFKLKASSFNNTVNIYKYTLKGEKLLNPPTLNTIILKLNNFLNYSCL